MPAARDANKPQGEGRSQVEGAGQLEGHGIGPIEGQGQAELCDQGQDQVGSSGKPRSQAAPVSGAPSYDDPSASSIQSSQRGQIVKLDRGLPLVLLADGSQVRCKHATALVKGHKQRAVIGDSVMVQVAPDADNGQISQILPRSNQLVRKDPAQRNVAQVMAANFDTVMVAHPIAELNIRRLERELVLAHETGAQVMVVLTKSDLADDEQLSAALAQVEALVAPGVDVVAVSEHEPATVEALRQRIPQGSVAVLIGRSGVGKSSLVNLLAGRQVAQTTPVRETDGKGRHTTVSRTMESVQGGGHVVDMPGVRGLGLWESEEGIQAAFPDIAELAASCRFRDCRHEGEPGCAVCEAVQDGRLKPERLDSYKHLVQENQEQERAYEEAQRVRSRTGHPRRRLG